MTLHEIETMLGSLGQIKDLAVRQMRPLIEERAAIVQHAINRMHITREKVISADPFALLDDFVLLVRDASPDQFAEWKGKVYFCTDLLEQRMDRYICRMDDLPE